MEPKVDSFFWVVLFLVKVGVCLLSYPHDNSPWHAEHQLVSYHALPNQIISSIHWGTTGKAPKLKGESGLLGAILTNMSQYQVRSRVKWVELLLLQWQHQLDFLIKEREWQCHKVADLCCIIELLYNARFEFSTALSTEDASLLGCVIGWGVPDVSNDCSAF